MVRRRADPVTVEDEQTIVTALTKKSNASAVAREVGRSFATVWRVARQNGIELTAGRKAQGYWRLAPERRAKVEAVVDANPGATQQEVGRQAGVSRSTARRVMLTRREATPG